MKRISFPTSSSSFIIFVFTTIILSLEVVVIQGLLQGILHNNQLQSPSGFVTRTLYPSTLYSSLSSSDTRPSLHPLHAVQVHQRPEDHYVASLERNERLGRFRRDQRDPQLLHQSPPNLKSHENHVEPYGDTKPQSSLVPKAYPDKNRDSFARGLDSSGNALASSSKSSSPIFCEQPLLPHSGVIIKPSKSKYPVNTFIFFTCHNTNTATAKCQEDGTWSRGVPHCPPTNESCPNLGDIPNGWMNVSIGKKASQLQASNPSAPKYPFNTKVKFFCYEGYVLEGAPVLICDTGFKWSFRMPVCRSTVSDSNASKGSSTKLTALLTSISIILTLVLLVAFFLWYRWKQRQRERKRWKRYFINYSYRQSKHNITHIRRPIDQQVDNNKPNEMKEFQKTAAVIPMTDL